MKTYCISNRKGGVGKTTTTVNLGTVPALAGKKVLIIDMDPQGNATQTFRCNNYEDENQADINDVLFNGVDIHKAIVHSEFYGIDVLPNNKKVRNPGEYFNDLYEKSERDSHKIVLRDALHAVADEYDYAFIDTNPSGGTMVDIQLTASDYVLIPVDVSGYSSDGISDELEDFYNVQDTFNPNLELKGVVLGDVNPRTNLTATRQQGYGKLLDNLALKTMIRHDGNLQTSSSLYEPLFSYKKKVNGCSDYINLAYELGIISYEECELLKKEYVKTVNLRNVSKKGRR